MANELRSAVQQRSQQVDELGLRMGHQIELRRAACRQALQDANPRMARALRAATQRTAQHLQELLLRLGHRMTVARTAGAQDLRRVASQLNALSPLAVLERGFSLTRTTDGKIIRDATDAPVGTQVETRLAHGSLASQVTAQKVEGRETKVEGRGARGGT
jgi:exodeoxyribonuclease VII large subunit